MSHKRLSLGAKGEEQAAKHLIQNGYHVIECNYRCRHGEIDIIAKEGRTLVFAEVKTRKSLTFGSPAAAVTQRKQRQISRVAQHYLASNKLFDTPARFDVISVFLPGSGSAQIEVIPNAFELAC